MKAAAGLLLTIGFLWALSVVWMFLTIAGIADSPRSMMVVVLYWLGMLIGPLSLIVGAVLVLRGISLRPGATLVGIGCLIFTGFILYNSVVGMRREPLEAPAPYFLYVVLLLVMILADAAAYQVYRAVPTVPPPVIRIGGQR